MRELFLQSTFSTVALEEGIAWWVGQLWPDCRVSVGAFDTLYQCVFDPDAHGLRDADGTLLLALDPESLDRLQGDELTIDRFLDALARLARRPRLQVVLALLQARDERHDETLRALAAVPGVIAVEHRHIERFLSGPALTPGSTAQAAGIPFTRNYLAALATAVAWRLDQLERPPGKVLALDCDHTLWSGVVAEDGIEGLRVEARHRRLTRIARRLRRAGWLIALCSRNELADVRAAVDALEDDQELGLTWDDLATTRVNWEPKADNLRSLADELGFGLDSVVFIDDDPVECARVRAALPEVSVLHVDPASDNDWLERVWRFEQRETTREDRQRARFYAENRQREKLRETHLSARDFLAALAIELSVERATDEDAPRIAQLSLRTNQFNFSGLKLGEAEARALVAAEDAVVLRARLRDRFGDYGLVGGAVGRARGEHLAVEGFWLSCRALGRGVEQDMVRELGAVAEAHGCRTVAFDLRELPRNVPARRFADTLAPDSLIHDGIEIAAAAARALRFDPDQAAPGQGTVPAPASPMTGAPASRDDALIARCAMDTALLEAIEAAVAPRPTLQRPYVAPRSELERTLAEIWAQTLSLDRVGIHDEFDELGGRSIQLVTIHARIHERLDQALEFIDLFRFTSIAALAGYLEGQVSGRVMDAVAGRGQRQRRASGGFRRIDRSGFRA